MKLRHLRCFHVLAEELSFTKAAQRLCIEQPPLTRAIRELENELGVSLFTRNTHQTQLTAEGLDFLGVVSCVFNTLNEAKNRLRVAASSAIKHLRIAVTDCTNTNRIAAILRCYRQKGPQLNVSVQEVMFTRLIYGLQNNWFDLGVSCSNQLCTDIAISKVWEDSLVAALPQEHPLAKYAKLTFA